MQLVLLGSFLLISSILYHPQIQGAMPLDTQPHPDPRSVEPHPEPARNVNNEVDYAPHPESSIPISPSRHEILKHITNLYSGSASESDMAVYAEQSIYDDPFSYCDTRHKIAGQWYGIPKLFVRSETLATEVVRSSDDELVWKQRQRYTFAGVHASYTADSLVSLKLEGMGGPERVVYHKDQWNGKDYSHRGLGMLIKKLNGYVGAIVGLVSCSGRVLTLSRDKLIHITKPPESV